MGRDLLTRRFAFANAVRDNPNEVAAAVDRLAAEYRPAKVNIVLDAVEPRLSVKSGMRRRLPQAIRDAACPVERCGYA